MFNVEKALSQDERDFLVLILFALILQLIVKYLEEKCRQIESLEKMKKKQQYYSKQLEEELEERRRHTKSLKKLKEELRCSICWESMKDPHLLPICCHRFCGQCIHDTMTSQNDRSCPLCRRSITIEPKRDEFARLVAKIITSNNESNQPSYTR